MVGRAVSVISSLHSILLEKDSLYGLQTGFMDLWYNVWQIPVLRIHLILMRIRIRILDPHWKKKIDSDPGHFLKIYWFFLTKKVFFCSFWLKFYPLDPNQWIRIYLRIRIQEVKILRIQRIRILSTGRYTIMLNKFNSFTSWKCWNIDERWMFRNSLSKITGQSGEESLQITIPTWE